MRHAGAWVACRILVAGVLSSGLAVQAASSGPVHEVVSTTLGVTAAPATASATTAAPTTTADEGTVLGPAGVVGATVQRLGGADRYASAVAISTHRYPSPASPDVVYLAHGGVFVDALAAGALTDGPVLLVRPACGSVPVPVMAEVRRLDPARVVALGGTSAVCEQSLQTAAQGRATGRIGGANRAETAAAIAGHRFPSGAATAYLARGEVSPDALGGGMLTDGPILLTSLDGTSVPPATASAIELLGATRVVALGGPATVSEDVLAAAAAGRQTARLAGADRYATSVAIGRHAYPKRTGRVYLARGDGRNFADALAAGMLVDGPVLLTPGTCEHLRASTAAFLGERTPSHVVALGGTGALCTSTLRGAALEARPAVDCAAVACVALTFDDGPSTATPTLLETLAANRVPATFFQVGQMVDRYPQHARRAYVEGHQVANHTWDHTQLTLLGRTGQQLQVDRTDAELGQHGVPETTLLRPPYGSYDVSTRRLGLPLVLWDVDPQDWQGPSARTVHDRVLAGVRPGSIVLQHDLHVNSVDAVPSIVRDLTARGYTFVTVSELVPGLRPGDLVYRRDRIVRAGTAMSPADVIPLHDGTVLGPVLDGAGVPGVAPPIPLRELVEQVTGRS